MKVSAKAEYACLAMLELANHHRGTRPLRVKEIAEAQGITQHFLVQILLQLKVAGLVTSTRGAGGGYHLARPPEEISLAAVIRAIDDRCLTPPAPASGSPRTPSAAILQEVWSDLYEHERKQLENLSLAELLLRGQRLGASTYQI
jgi:Rrf2 family cysteine metabolism transcriptional repressor